MVDSHIKHVYHNFVAFEEVFFVVEGKCTTLKYLEILFVMLDKVSHSPPKNYLINVK